MWVRSCAYNTITPFFTIMPINPGALRNKKKRNKIRLAVSVFTYSMWGARGAGSRWSRSVGRGPPLCRVVRRVYPARTTSHVNAMDVLPSGNLFRELQDVTDTGYFEWKLSLEDYWQQVSAVRPSFLTSSR